MRGVLLILAVLLALPAASAVDAELLNALGTCDSTGNVVASYLHKGGILPIGDIKVVAEHSGTNRTSNVEGYWEQDGRNVTLITEASVDGATRVFFHSTNDAFSKTGAYILKLTYFASKTDYFATEVSAQVFCPGKNCQGDSDCSEDEYCNENKCTALRCDYGEYMEFNRCRPICNDNNPCTQDVYSNGNCIFKQSDNCCIADSACNDGATCTIDKCINNQCSYSPLKCEASTDKCVAAKCIEPKGCVYETDEQCLTSENEKKEYFITIGEPTVHKKSFFTKIGEWLDRFFGNFF
ncbi:hypothetical protein KY308_01855 [Candidatus Woesearchaeota archaeon]|nr:hypothetical protein [Candidatus Woesearchaeota archaeon]